MKKQEVSISQIKVKKQVLDVLERLEGVLNSEKQDVSTVYGIVGKSDKQATGWKKDENGEYPLLWEDEEKTIPKMEDIYDYIPKLDDDFSEDDKARIEAIEIIRKALYALI